jgi:hypothetical protein
MVFGWTKQKFPFTVKSVHDLTIAEHVVTVTGKAFYDIAHAPADHSNRRHSPKDYAVWEIHPVMKLEVIHEVLGTNCRQSKESRVEFGLRVNAEHERANDVDC